MLNIDALHLKYKDDYKMDTNNCLVIVDMQHYFTTAQNPKTIQACKREIKKSLSKEIPIVFLEYSTRLYGRTLATLQELVEEHRGLVSFVDKDTDDGSVYLIRELNERLGNIPKNFRFCGVNRSACVKSTIGGLLLRESRVRKITIVDDAVNDSYNGVYPYDIVNNSKVKIINVAKKRKKVA